MPRLFIAILGVFPWSAVAGCGCGSGAPCNTAVNELQPADAAQLCAWMYDNAALERQHQCERWCVAVGARDEWVAACTAGLAGCDAAARTDGCTTADVEACYRAHRGAPCELAAAVDCDGLSFCCADSFMLDFWGPRSPPLCGQ